MSDETIPITFLLLPAVISYVCSIMAAYTFIGFLDHERWMKEWGSDHEAVPVMHLRWPILSSAITMGIGGITTVHQVGLASITLAGIERRCDLLLTIISCIAAVTAAIATLGVARKDPFAEVDRTLQLKQIIFDRYSIASLKRQKNVGRRVAYLAKPFHVITAGVILAAGIMSSWVINVLAMTGDFVVVWRVWPTIVLVFVALVMSIASSWLLFRLLVWKVSDERLRPPCSVFLATTIWIIDFVGNMSAIRYEALDGREPHGNLTVSFAAHGDGGMLLLVLLAFWAVWTEYAIALELRVAYCGLQDANFDLVLMAGSPGVEEASRRSSARGNQGGAAPAQGGNRRANNNPGPRSPMQRRASMSTRIAASSSPTTQGLSLSQAKSKSPASSTAEKSSSKPNAAPTSAVAAAISKVSSVRLGPVAQTTSSRSIRVQPVGGQRGSGDGGRGEAYMALTSSTVASDMSLSGPGSTGRIDEEVEDGAAGKSGDRKSSSEAGWVEVAGKGAAGGPTGPSQKIDMPCENL